MPAAPNRSAAPEASPYARHIPALDGIRGFALLGVAASHLFPGTARTPVARLVQDSLLFGATGVDLFFVLSGFLITGILYDSLHEPRFFRKFYARRVLRIFPLYYGVLALFALGTPLFGWHYNNQLWSMALYLQNTSLIALPIYAYAGPSQLPLPHFWSLAVEEQFYLVWPLLVFLLRTRRRLLLTCLLVALACPVARFWLWFHHWPYYPVHMSSLTRADSLLAGAALALLLRGPHHDTVLRTTPWLCLPGLLLVIAGFYPLPLHLPARDLISPAQLSLLYVGLYLTSAALIALALQPGRIARLFRLAPLRSVGKYSYGLYVLHYPLFGYLQEPTRRFVAQHLTSNKGIGILLAGLLGFTLSYLAAFASYHLYEKHFLRLKRFFSYTREPRPQATA